METTTRSGPSFYSKISPTNGLRTEETLPRKYWLEASTLDPYKIHGASQHDNRNAPAHMSSHCAIVRTATLAFFKGTILSKHTQCLGAMTRTADVPRSLNPSGSHASSPHAMRKGEITAGCAAETSHQVGSTIKGGSELMISQAVRHHEDITRH